MFGLGVPELFVLLILGLMLVGGPIMAVAIVLSMAKKGDAAGRPDSVADLRAEVQRLREDVERLKKGSA